MINKHRLADFTYNHLFNHPKLIAHRLVDLYYKYFRHDYFNYMGVGLPCFYHEYNSTRLNERQIEVSIIEKYLSNYDPGDVLEIGNVLSYYRPVSHTVIDKFEAAPGVINADASTYDPGRTFKLIFSISTFEHIGYSSYGESYQPRMLQAAIDNAVRLLAPGGTFVFTGAIGYNPIFDRVTDIRGFTSKLYYKRVGGVWACVHRDSLEYLWFPVDDKRLTREVFIGTIKSLAGNKDECKTIY